jgi:hypothetical protein
MAKLYAQKITNNEINALTGEAWTLEDVPMLWRAEVEELLNVETIDQ